MGREDPPSMPPSPYDAIGKVFLSAISSLRDMNQYFNNTSWQNCFQEAPLWQVDKDQAQSEFEVFKVISEWNMWWPHDFIYTHNYPSSLTWIYPGMVRSISPPWRLHWAIWWWAPASPGPAQPRPSSSCPWIRWDRADTPCRLILIAQCNVVTSQDGFSLTKGQVSWVGSLMPVGALIGQYQPPGQ